MQVMTCVYASKINFLLSLNHSFYLLAALLQHILGLVNKKAKS